MQSFIWTFVYSDEEPDGIPQKLVDHQSRHAAIYTTSLHESCWSHLHKTTLNYYLIMKPWSWDEMLWVTSALGLDSRKDHIKHLFDTYGPTPHLNWRKLSRKPFSNNWKTRRVLFMDEISHMICLLTCWEDRIQPEVAPMTEINDWNHLSLACIPILTHLILFLRKDPFLSTFLQGI